MKIDKYTVALLIGLAALIVGIINAVIAAFSVPSLIMLIAMIAIFCSNFATWLGQKRKNPPNKKC